MPKAKILIVNSNRDTVDLVRNLLVREGYQVLSAPTGEEALSVASRTSPDLVILDLMLPDTSGLEVCRFLKDNPSSAHVRIIMLTAVDNGDEIATALELGADDYVTKPFSSPVLISRIKAVLRRVPVGGATRTSMIKRRDLSIDLARHAVRLHGEALDLTATEFKLLHFLSARPGWVYSREQIINAVRGTDYPVTERSVDVQVVGLRKKLGYAGNLIETVRGVGYRFKDMPTERDG